MTYKTVLAPNAPWPKYEEKEVKPPKPKPKPRVPKPKKAPSKITLTDAKYAEWAERNLAKEIK